MSEIEKIQQYIEKTKLCPKTKYTCGMCISEMDAFHEVMHRDEFRAMGPIFAFGQAKGYRAAKAEARRG